MGGAALLGGFMGGAVEGVAQHFTDRRARNQQLSDEERQAHYDQITQGISGAQSKLATLAPGSPEYAQTSDDITKAHGMLTDLFHPSTGPGALAHLGRIVSERWLHRQQEPQTQTEMVRGLDQPRLVATPGTAAVAGSTILGMVPGTSMTTPDLPSIAPGKTVVPARAGPLVATQVPIPKTAGEAKQRAAEFMARFGQEATPAPTNKFSDLRSSLKTALPNLADADLDRAVEVAAGLEAKPVAEKQETWKPLGKPFPAEGGGGYFQTYQNAQGQTRRQAMPEGYAPPPAASHPATNIATERASFKSDHNIPEDRALSFKQEQEFLRGLYAARNPYAGARVGMAREGLSLREGESQFKDFLALQKQLTPFEKVAGTSDRADEYVSSPSGPGDVALTLAFVDAIKPSSGFRFTNTEKEWIVGSRGTIAGVEARINSGFTGEVLSPEQRQRMAAIIKNAATQASKQKDALVSGAGQFRPAVAAAAALNGAGGGTVKMKAPDGTLKAVPADQVEHYKSQGAVVVQ